MGNTTDVLVPDIGDFKDVDIIEVMVAPGDRVSAEDPLITLESDKATMEVPAPVSGVIKAIKVAAGGKVSEGTLIAILETDAQTPAAPSAPAPESVAESPPQTGGATSVIVTVPDIGDFHDVDVIEVAVKPGDSVQVEDTLITLESDKATMDVPTTHAGVIGEVYVAAGDKVSEGTAVLTLLAAGENTTPPEESVATMAPEDETPPEPKAIPATPPASAPRPAPTAPIAGGEAGSKAHATPSVRRFARELGVDLARVTGTGRKGRIVKEDVNRYVKDALAQPAAAAGAGGFSLPEMPTIDFSKFGEIEVRPLSRIKKLSGANLHRAWLHVPHVTQHDDADITEVEAFRRSLQREADAEGVRITMLAFLLKASVAALKAYPTFNASLDPEGESLIIKHYYHLGIAVDTPDGLVVPVIRDVDKKGIFDLAREMGEISIKARKKKLAPGDMQGGSFTISSLGGIGGTAFTPIVNAPEVAILGVSRSAMKPVFVDGEFVPRLILPLSLSYDHRVVDGAAAARFTALLAKVLGDVRRLLL